jgi:acetyl-CoA carboxylase carboxyl transferase subunit alpha
MARPEGYRKTQRLMKTADRFGLPVVTLVDTAGAYPGIDAEARGQAEAIASSVAVCLGLRVPLVSVLIGEGGSGGAIALATANSVIMLEHSVYSVISPEGCASILWRDGDKSREIAAQALRLTARDLHEIGVVDRVLEEPLGGAHRDPATAIATVGDAIEVELAALTGAEGGILKARRRDKFLEIGKKGLS